MLVKPNQTVLRARVQEVRPGPDGFGAEIQLLVLENESSSSDRDFLRVAEGTSLPVFYSRPAGVQAGDEVRVTASLNAGPSGGRTVIENLEPVAAAPTPSPSAKRRRPGP